MEMVSEPVSLKKSVGLLHSSGTTHFFDKKIYHILLKHAYEQLLSEDVHFIELSTLKEKIKFNSNNLQAIKDSLTRLKTISIEFDVLGQLSNFVKKRKVELQLGNWHTLTLLAEASIDNGIISYEFSSTMRRLLYEPDLYELIDISIAHEFNSGYAYCLYEIGVRAMKIGGTGWISLDQFRKIMDVPSDFYPRFNDLRKRVILVAESEVNALFDQGVCPVKVEVLERRQGRGVGYLNISIVDKKDVKKLEPKQRLEREFTDAQEILILKLNEKYKLHMKQACLLVKEFSETHIENILTKVDEAKKSKGFNSHKIAGFTHASIKNSIRLDSEPVLAKLSRKESLEKPLQPYEHYFNQFCEQYIDALDVEEQTQLLQDILKSPVCPISSMVSIKVEGMKGQGRQHVIQCLSRKPFIKKLQEAGLKNLEQFDKDDLKKI